MPPFGIFSLRYRDVTKLRERGRGKGPSQIRLRPAADECGH
jgi:hypothetical protein